MTGAAPAPAAACAPLRSSSRGSRAAFVFTPHELIERLVALVPRPRAHLTRYFGVFAPAFAARAGIVPAIVPAVPRIPAGADGGAARGQPKRRRFPWASMIWRVFLTDVLECTRCKGRMEIAAIHEYIEVFYNRRRRHTTLGGKPPAIFEALAERQLSQAA